MLLARVQQILQGGPRGFAACRPVVCIGVLRIGFSALKPAFPLPPAIEEGMKCQLDMFLWVAVLAYLFSFYSERKTEHITKEERLITKIPMAEETVSGLRSSQTRASSKKLHAGHGSFKDSSDQFGNENWRTESDMHIIDCAQTEGVAHERSKVLQVIHACIRLRHGGTALYLFDQMLKKGAVPKAHLITKAVSQKFFKLVADNLDDKRMREDGLRLLDLVQAHGITPSPAMQNCLVLAWKNEFPQSVLEYFLKMRSAGVSLSRWAYGSIVVANERPDPEFALEVFEEMEQLGISPHRAAYNAALGAYSQLSMGNEARKLFDRMADRGLVPNAKSFGIMIKVYTSGLLHEEAVALFEKMREQRLEPDRYAYHHAIFSCIQLQRIEFAMALYKDMVQANVPVCMNTYDLLIGALKTVDWKPSASKLMADLVQARQADAAREGQ